MISKCPNMSTWSTLTLQKRWVCRSGRCFTMARVNIVPPAILGPIPAKQPKTGIDVRWRSGMSANGGKRTGSFRGVISQ